MKLVRELSENWFKQKFYHALGKISAEDIVDGAKFTLGTDAQAVAKLLGNVVHVIVDEKGDRAFLAMMDPDTGEIIDTREPELNISDLYDGDAAIKRKLQARKPPKEPERHKKSVIAALLNKIQAKRIS